MSIIKTTYTDTEGNKYYKATFVLLSRKRVKDSCGDWFGKCQLCKTDGTEYVIQTFDANVSVYDPKCKVEVFDFCESCADEIEEYDESNVYFIYRKRKYKYDSEFYRNK